MVGAASSLAASSAAPRPPSASAPRSPLVLPRAGRQTRAPATLSSPHGPTFPATVVRDRKAPLTATAPGVRPIIFIPGITGSFLADAAGNEAWPDAAQLVPDCEIPPPTDLGCEHLKLASDVLNADGSVPPGGADVASGLTGESPLVGSLGGVVDSQTENVFLVLNETQDLYDVTAANARESGYVVPTSDDAAGLSVCAGIAWCFVPVGVDWRRSSEFNEHRVMSIIDEVLAATGSDRVDILAHSQGGLIANALVHDTNSVDKIYRVVTLGTPYLGAPKVLEELLYASPCQFPYSGNIFGAQCLVDPTVVQSLIANYPGAAELAPSEGYYEVGPYCPIYNSSGCLSYPQSQAYIASILAAPPLGRLWLRMSEGVKLDHAYRT